MENASYATLSRQSGLIGEMQTVAQNIANMGTTGYRAERLIFAEFVKDLDGNSSSLSSAFTGARTVDTSQGGLQQTNGTFDLAIEGPGYFLLSTEEGDRLTRAGAFSPGPDGILVASDGAQLLDNGGAPIFVPAQANRISVGADGTMTAGATPLAQIGIWQPENPLQIARSQGVRFDPVGQVLQIDSAKILQGFLEKSNVDPVLQIARMVEVQRAYELGQSFLDKEDERVRGVIRAFGQ